MEGQELPDGVRSFISQCISSAQAAETLSVLCQDAERLWSAAEIAAELGITARAAEQTLDELVARGLVDIRIGERLLYRFAPIRPDLERQARRFAAIYPLRRAAAFAEIARGAAAPVHDFADAFRIRRQRRG